MSEDVLYDKVNDPSTSAAELQQIAAQRPDLRAAVAAHPNAYPELLSWLAAQGDPVVRATVEARGIAPGALAPAAVPQKKSRTGLIIGLVVGGVLLLGIIGAVIAGLLIWNVGSSVVNSAQSVASSALAEQSTGAAASSSGSLSAFCAVADNLVNTVGDADYTNTDVVESLLSQFQQLATLAPSTASAQAYQAYVDALKRVLAGEVSASSDLYSGDVYSNFISAFGQDYVSCY